MGAGTASRSWPGSGPAPCGLTVLASSPALPPEREPHRSRPKPLRRTLAPQSTPFASRVRYLGAQARVGVVPLSGRDCWPQGQLQQTVLLCKRERERDQRTNRITTMTTAIAGSGETASETEWGRAMDTRTISIVALVSGYRPDDRTDWGRPERLLAGSSGAAVHAAARAARDGEADAAKHPSIVHLGPSVQLGDPTTPSRCLDRFDPAAPARVVTQIGHQGPTATRAAASAGRWPSTCAANSSSKRSRWRSGNAAPTPGWCITATKAVSMCRGLRPRLRPSTASEPPAQQTVEVLWQPARRETATLMAVTLLAALTVAAFRAGASTTRDRARDALAYFITICVW